MQLLPKILKISNLTTGLAIYSIQGVENGHQAEVVSFTKDELLVGLCKAIGVGQLVTLEIELPIEGQPVIVHASGKLTHSEKFEGGFFEVMIDIHHIDDEPWEKFFAGHQAEQERLSNLLKAMKGQDE